MRAQAPRARNTALLHLSVHLLPLVSYLDCKLFEAGTALLYKGMAHGTGGPGPGLGALGVREGPAELLRASSSLTVGLGCFLDWCIGGDPAKRDRGPLSGQDHL